MDATSVGLVRVGAWVMIVCGAALSALLALSSPVRLDQVALNLVPVVAGTGALICLRRGATRLAARILIWMFFLTAALAMLRNGGVYGPSMLNYPLLIVMCGWILGRRATWRLTLAIALLLLSAFVLDEYGLIPAPVYGGPLVLSVYLAGVIGVTAAITLLSRREYVKQVLEARAIADNLRLREIDLRKFYLAAQQNPVSIMIAGANHRVEYVNDSFLRTSGLTRERCMGCLPGELSPDAALADAMVLRVLQTGESWVGERTGEHNGGSHYPAFVTVTPIRQADGSISHYLTAEQDLTEQRLAEQRIDRLTNFNHLTGLPNRNQLLRYLELGFELTRQRGERDALVVLDIDRFQNVNNARGSEIGDRLLHAIGQRLLGMVRKGDFLAHLGADEYALVLHDQGRDLEEAYSQAMTMAQAIHASLSHTVRVAGGPASGVMVTACLGITLYPVADDDTVAEALRRGHTALGRAKKRGVRQTVFFEAGMGHEAEARYELESALRHAVGNQELRLFLQSQVDRDGRLVGAEALVRWQRPQHGMVAPGLFIGLAEESDLIIEIGDWVLEQACAILGDKQAQERRLQLSVNLSPRQFRQHGLTERVHALLEQYGVPPEQLVLEITESIVLDDVEMVIEKMHALRALGVRFSLDDFGTGYSSLRYLKRLPLYELKIDRSFVQDAPHDRDDAALVETILAVAQHLQLEVVAEGVERPEHAAFLIERMPSIVCQGYLFGRPMPAEEWLRQYQSSSETGSLTASEP